MQAILTVLARKHQIRRFHVPCQDYYFQLIGHVVLSNFACVLRVLSFVAQTEMMNSGALMFSADCDSFLQNDFLKHVKFETLDFHPKGAPHSRNARECFAP